ncbi:MAG TPA: hypothetical protein VGP95_04910 [Gemmatimonadaceae bacterium]|nr:hypothetical protein [Gemmatimonadaceae bacterium]
MSVRVRRIMRRANHDLMPEPHAVVGVLAERSRKETRVVKLRGLAPVRGLVAALLVFVASSATSMASAAASPVRHDDPAIQSTPALHAPVAHRVADEQRSHRRVAPPADLPFVADTRRADDTKRPSRQPALVERAFVARSVPRVYDATAPPARS